MLFYKLKQVQQNILFRQMNNQIRLLGSQVSGKNAKFTDSQGQFVYKKLSLSQYQFYLFIESLQINDSQYGLKKFLPKFKGKKEMNTTHIQYNPQDASKICQWISHMSSRNKIDSEQTKEFIVLENLTKSYEYPCLMDIKLGQKKITKASNKKFEKSTTNSHHFRINGMSNLFVEQKQPYFISKYYFQKTSPEEIQNHISFFFFDGDRLDLELIRKCVQQIKQIILVLEAFKIGRFESTSLLVCYDAYNHSKFAVKLIDFDKYELLPQENGDQNIIIGLKYFIWYLNSICDHYDTHERVIRSKKMGVFQNFENIPKQKLKQFQILSPKEEISPQKLKLPEVQEIVLEVK